MQMCFGTANLGRKYGIKNQRKLNRKESFDLIQRAIDEGIRCFDTAFAYGISEELLGEVFSKDENKTIKIKVITKIDSDTFTNNSSTDYAKLIMNKCKQSCTRLSIDKLEGLLLHSAKDMYDDKILNALYKCKETGLVDNVGVSIYEPDEAMYAAKAVDIDFIQVPYNIFDRRLDKLDFFDVAKANNKTIFARSIFLQGLLSMDEKDIPENLNGVIPYICALKDVKNGYGISELCITFCKKHGAIDYLVLGHNSETELLQNIKSIGSSIDQTTYDKIINEFNNIEEKYIDPRKW